MLRSEFPTLHGIVSNSQQLQSELYKAFSKLKLRAQYTSPGSANGAGYVAPKASWTAFCAKLTAMAGELDLPEAVPPVGGKTAKVDEKPAAAEPAKA